MSPKVSIAIRAGGEVRSETRHGIGSNVVEVGEAKRARVNLVGSIMLDCVTVNTRFSSKGLKGPS